MNITNRIILLVEDNPDDKELTRVAIAEFRVANELAVVRDGQEELDYLYAAGKYAGRDGCVKQPRILLGMMLAKVVGLVVLRGIRAVQRTKLLPMVVLSSSKEECDLVESYTLGANSYTQKPLAFTRCTDAVRQLGLYRLELNELPRPA